MSQPKSIDFKKLTPARPPSPLSQFLRTHARRLLLAVMTCAAASAGVYAVWRSVAHDVLRHDQFRLALDQITVTPPPAWIHTTDIRGEVFRDGGFEGDAWLHDPNLAEKIAKTFELHPWVANVKRVDIRGATVDVELVYRKPVCMVEVAAGLVLPVDAEGVVLPRDDFTPAEARSYPRLAGVTSAPVGSVGLPWGDLHVVGGAEIAAALADCWDELKLDHIAVIATGTPDILFELVPRTVSGRSKDRIIWGHAPGLHTAGEPAIEEKIARLKIFLGEAAAADNGATPPRELDLRQAGAKRTALRADTPGTETK